jgi:preprotein translocase subunit SecF
MPMAEVIDLSVSQTMARTMLTTGTTVATLIVLLIFGGEALRPFTATLPSSRDV